MTSVQGRSCLHQEYLFIVPPNSSLLPKSEFSKQFAGLPGPKLSATTTNVPNYSKNDLQQILKTVLEAQTFASVFTSTTSKEPQEKPLKTCSLDVYCRKSHINRYDFCQKCENYNFCQQCEDYFAIVGATGANRICFAVSFL